MFDGLGKMINILLFLVILFVPLGLWKLLEIIFWIFNHVKIAF